MYKIHGEVYVRSICTRACCTRTRVKTKVYEMQLKPDRNQKYSGGDEDTVHCAFTLNESDLRTDFFFFFSVLLVQIRKKNSVPDCCETCRRRRRPINRKNALTFAVQESRKIPRRRRRRQAAICRNFLLRGFRNRSTMFVTTAGSSVGEHIIIVIFTYRNK